LGGAALVPRQLGARHVYLAAGNFACHGAVSRGKARDTGIHAVSGQKSCQSHIRTHSKQIWRRNNHLQHCRRTALAHTGNSWIHLLHGWQSNSWRSVGCPCTFNQNRHCPANRRSWLSLPRKRGHLDGCAHWRQEGMVSARKQG